MRSLLFAALKLTFTQLVVLFLVLRFHLGHFFSHDIYSLLESGLFLLLGVDHSLGDRCFFKQLGNISLNFLVLIFEVFKVVDQHLVAFA